MAAKSAREERAEEIFLIYIVAVVLYHLSILSMAMSKTEAETILGFILSISLAAPT